jgi:hypothetical protein
MQNHQKQHYEAYYLISSDGSIIKTTRRECFAQAEPVTTDNLYPQRWYYSPDGQMAVRLPRSELGEKMGKQNAADLKAEERVTERKNLCIGQTSHATCSVTCDTCPCRNYCDSEYRKDNGINCTRKCDYCNVYVGRTIEMDRPIGEEDDNTEIIMEFSDENENIEATYTANEKNNLVQSVVSTLKPEDRELWKCLVLKVKKEEVAKRLGISVDGVTYRQKRLYRILLSNPNLKNIFKNY